MSSGRECCGWTVWFEMAGIDEDGKRIAAPTAPSLHPIP